MGNSLHVPYIGNAQFPCHLKLRPFAAIDLSKHLTTKYADGTFWENWNVSYIVEGSSCNFTFTRFTQHDNVERVSFSLSDGRYLNLNCDWVGMEITRTDLLRIVDLQCRWLDPYSPKFEPIKWMTTKATIDRWGVAKDTNVYLYGSGNRRGLLVSVSKKNSGDKEPSAFTVVHYFANSSGRIESDIGLSMVVKICVSNGKLVVKVEGPRQHYPASALFYMFDQVKMTGIWKPTMCPHCDIIRWQRNEMLSLQSDSEDSDSDHPRAPCYGRWENSRTGINNDGRFKGNANASLVTLGATMYTLNEDPNLMYTN